MANAALIALLGLGVVGVAVAASNKSTPALSGAPAENDLLGNARAMSAIFDLYSRTRGELSAQELETLARLNAEAKGVVYLSLHEFAKAWPNPNEPQPMLIHWFWRRRYFLPPGVDELFGPDMFSIWAGQEPEEVCEEYWQFGCRKGYMADWFGRDMGGFEKSTTVYGQSDFWVISEGIYNGLKDTWDIAGEDLTKSIASIASNYPGIGTVIAAAVTFLSAIGEGASLEDASLAAGRAAVPSTLRSAYDVGVGIAVDGELDYAAALDVLMAAAISEGVISGDVLERYNTMVSAYEDAKEIGGGLGTLGTATELAAATN